MSSTTDPFRDPTTNMATHTDIVQAVRDTVTVKGHKIGRSNTQNPPPGKPVPPTAKRSQSQDSGAAPKVPPKGKKSAKGSQHADVIDRLDFSGVGPMFHHDGPFDACAPSRNRHRTKAPMMAWGADARHDQGPYPAPNAPAYGGFSESYAEQPKKKVDVLAEAWGIHEPEPFEDFSAGGGDRGGTPASSIYNGRSGTGNKSRGDGRDHREVYKEYLEDPSARVHRTPRKTGIPPPQPIFVPDPSTPPVSMDQTISASPGSGGFPKRSKSLMQRIRKMRDAPNVPVGGGDYDETPASPPLNGNYPPPSPRANNERSRPTHRSQNSLFGRFGNRNASNSRSPPPPSQEENEPYVFIDPTPSATGKDLPAVPGAGYFDAADAPVTTASSPGGAGLGRKTSLMKKVGRVVRGQR